MARPLRIEAPGHYFHVLARGNARHPIFLDDDDRGRFLETLVEAIERFRVRCHAYCLMGNHYHLLLQPTEENLSRTLRHVNGVYSQRFNRRHGRVGHVFAGRFKSLLVDRETYLREIVRYIALNPVRSGLVTSPEAWRWSSYRTTAGWTTSPAWLTVTDLLDVFGGGTRNEAQESIRRFVMEGTDSTPDGADDSIARVAERGGILGGEGFLKRHASRIGPRIDDRQFVKRDRFVGRPTLCQLFQDVPRSGPAWVRAVCRARWSHGFGIGEIATCLGVDRRTVSELSRRIDTSNGGPDQQGLNLNLEEL